MHILTSLSAPSSQHSWTQRQVFEFRAQGVSCVWGQKVIGQGESEVISSFPLPFILTCELEFYVGSQDVNIIVLYSWFHVDTRSDFLIFQEWVVTQISYQYDIVHTNIYGKNIFYIFFIIFLWAGCLHGESLIAPFVCFLFFCSFLKAHQERWGRFFGSLKVGEIRKQENPKWRWFPTIISFWKSFSVVGKQPGWCQEGLTVYFWSGEQESATISWFSYNWGWSEHLRESSSLRTGLPWTTQCRLSDNVIIIMWIHCWCILETDTDKCLSFTVFRTEVYQDNTLITQLFLAQYPVSTIPILSGKYPSVGSDLCLSSLDKVRETVYMQAYQGRQWSQTHSHSQRMLLRLRPGQTFQALDDLQYFFLHSCHVFTGFLFCIDWHLPLKIWVVLYTI